MSTAFDNVHLPDDIESGALVGPQFQTGVISLSSGAEQRNANWDQERLVADIGWGVQRREDPDDVADGFARILAFFRARMGMQRAFLFKDWSDYIGKNERLFLKSDQTTGQITRQYDNYLRKITRPLVETVVMRSGTGPGVVVDPVTGGDGVPGWSVGEKGLVTFAGPVPGGKSLFIDFEFDVPMRFDVDMAQVTLIWHDAGSVGSIKLIQVRE